MSTPGSSLRESLAEYQGSHLLTIAWILIFLAGTFDFGYEKVHCINGFAIECSGIDFTNLLLGGVAACILYFGKYDSPKSEWGAAASGIEGLWSRQTTQGLAPLGNRPTPGGQVQAEVGYGVAAFDTGLLTPYAGTVLSDGADRTYRVGTRLQLPGSGATGLTLNLEGTRQEPAGSQPVNQGLRLQVTWGF